MSWNQLYSILQAAAEERQQQQENEPPVCCPNDAHTLQTGPDGKLFCVWDGWHED